ncbi:MAG: HU family DNA-binding protein [Opitutales bacterium]|jgi:DNA-binding protein HU-beta|tara:strand:- start:203 stop:484 length:282 start_codon:yes stop_codon:yes gene_type:complete
MNKGQLIEAIQKKLGKDTTKAAADLALNTVIDCITAGVKKDKEKGVQIIGFGTFSIVKRAARAGINPQTQEKIKIKASKSVKFKPGAKLKAAI